ncbi:MAG: hypothetical protein ACE5NG_08955 [bacterium]
MLTASDKALNKLQEWLMQKYYQTGVGFRILAISKESGEPRYAIKLDRQHQGDKIADLNGIKFLFEPASTIAFTDYELDYLDEPGGGFILRKSGGNNG